MGGYDNYYRFILFGGVECVNPTVEIIMNDYPLTVFVIIKEQLFRSRNIVLRLAMLYIIILLY